MIKKILDMTKKIIERIKFKVKLKKLDNRWYDMGGDSYGLFPPSFYYTHTKEEIERMRDEKIKELKAFLEKLDERE